MKNKIKIIGYIFLFISFISNLNADEFNIVANEIIVDKENNPYLISDYNYVVHNKEKDEKILLI